MQEMNSFPYSISYYNDIFYKMTYNVFYQICTCESDFVNYKNFEVRYADG